MLYTNIAVAEKYDYLEDKFKLAYKWLKETDLEATPVGNYPLAEGIRAMVQEYTTVPENEKRFETHEKFFDIQYLVSGEEKIGICKREDLKATEGNAEKDLFFYEAPELAGEILLRAGDLVVVAPEDAHRPGCIAGKAMPVKKVVVKIFV